MAYAVEPQIFTQFKGIREQNGVSSGGVISALECKNVEIIPSEAGENTGIKTMDGNSPLITVDEGYSIIGVFNTNQDDVDYTFIYAESENDGILYYINPSRTLTAAITGLTVTGKSNGITMTSSAYDVFVFTNGVDAYSFCFAQTPMLKPLNFNYCWENNGAMVYTINANPAVDDYVYTYNNSITADKITAITTSDNVVTSITVLDHTTEQTTTYTRVTRNDSNKIYKKDYQERELHWLGMCEWNGFLVIADDYGVHGSHQNDIYTFNDNPSDVANSWYIDFSKHVTAVFSYTGGLYIFTGSDVTFLNTTPNDTTNSRIETAAGVGCYSYSSIVKHDTFLFFYDNNQKNIYYIQNIDNGQIRPAGPVAREIQTYFNDVKRFKMYSCIYENKNEVWCIINDKLLIFDYFRQEWLERIEQSLNGLCLSGNVILSGGDDGILFAERYNTSFSGSFYPAVYDTAIINLSTNTNLKKQKTPLLIVVNSEYVNDFWVQLTVNNKAKNPKRVKVARKTGGIYAADNEPTVLIPDERKRFAIVDEQTGEVTSPGGKYGERERYNKKVVEISTPQTWYTMGIKIYTDRAGQAFCIDSMELKNIKMKTKTKGR